VPAPMWQLVQLSPLPTLLGSNLRVSVISALPSLIASPSGPLGMVDSAGT